MLTRALGGVCLATACALLVAPADAAFTPHGLKRSVITRPHQPTLGQEALVTEAIQAGAKDFIVKPFKPDAVLATLRKVVEKSDP